MIDRSCFCFFFTLAFAFPSWGFDFFFRSLGLQSGGKLRVYRTGTAPRFSFVISHLTGRGVLLWAQTPIVKGSRVSCQVEKQICSLSKL